MISSSSLEMLETQEFILWLWGNKNKENKKRLQMTSLIGLVRPLDVFFHLRSSSSSSDEPTLQGRSLEWRERTPARRRITRREVSLYGQGEKEHEVYGNGVLRSIMSSASSSSMTGRDNERVGSSSPGRLSELEDLKNE